MKTYVKVLCVVFAAFVVFGYGKNIVTLYKHSEEMTSGQVVIRGIGIVGWPIGVVMGYIGE